jgi:hypothetical protein
LPFFESCYFPIQAYQVEQYGDQDDETNCGYDIDLADTSHEVRGDLTLRRSGLAYAKQNGKEPDISHLHEGLK